VAPHNFIIRIRSVWWSSVLFALVFFCQMSIEASDYLFAANNETYQFVAGSDSTLSQQQHSTGKLSRRAKAAQRRMSTSTAGIVTRDTSRQTLEAIRALPRDSSARLAQFQYIRKDKPAENRTYHKNHPMFLSDPIIVKHQAVLDSTKWVYRLRETVDEKDIRLSTEVPLEEYSSLRLKQAMRQNWESMAQFYQLQGETKTTLGDVFGKITKIEIPVPKNPIFSIFGPSRISMTINGAIDIHAGFRNIKSDLYVSSALGQSQSTPDFSQEIQVNVKGEIGDKLKIDADWNTQRTFEYENQLHVKYQGYEDELVQSVEAGNVSLPTNSSFISGGSALFGILAKFQIGPLSLTTVTTQKKGQIKELSLSGGGQSTPLEIRPANYSRCHFFIDTSYIKFYENVYQAQPLITPVMQTMHIRDIEVWVSTKTEMDPAKYRNVLALMDGAEVERIVRDNDLAARLPGAKSPVQGQVEEAKFIKLDPSTYDFDPYAGIISLRSQPQDDQVVAVYYMIDNNGSFKTIGQSSQTPKDSIYNLILKLVRPSQLNPTLQPAWTMMLKNRYSLGGTGIDQSSFQFHIDYQLPGQTPVTDVTPQNVGVMEMLGLDRYSNDGTNKPDKVFDYIKNVTINETRGEIIFPTVQPFDSSSMYSYFIKHGISASLAQTYADSFSYRAIYTKDIIDAVNDPRNLYYLRGSVKTAQSASYSVGFNIVEGSVQVIVDGQLATAGVDYTVDYISGQVVIKNQALLSPGRNVQIKYEANDMFQLASKSLLGARGDFNLGKNTSLGFTIMNYSQQSLSDKVRLGEEPISNTIMGIDGGTTLDANWLTTALNYLPGVKTMALSQISVHGEVAYMMPNPNTRTSPISSDGSKGVAYIDDFEGARQIIPLGVSYAQWKDASAPWFIKNLDSYVPVSSTINGPDYIPTSNDVYAAGIKADTEKMYYKAKACWFNVVPSDVQIPTIWGDRKSFAQGQGQVTSLDFYFHPESRGEFNYSMNLQQTIGLDSQDPNSHKKSWAGIQHVLGTSSTNLVEQNVAFIELWINIVSPTIDNDSAKLNIDLGYISEDVIPNKTLNTEDGLDNPLHTPRGIMNQNYDWGLDTINDATERIYYENFWKQYPNHPEYASDPSGDDYTRLPIGNGTPLNMAIAEQYEGVNGTEGNFVSEDGHFPDTEDLNRNGKVDRLNSYFEYEIPLDTTNVRFKQLITGAGENHWFQIRIPLSGYNRTIGEPTFTDVEGVRVWVTGAGKPVLFRVVDFNLVGNQWEKRIKTDSSFEVSVVNYEDDPLYTMPDPNLRTKDLTQPDQNIYSNEQSLNIIVRNLQDGQYKEAVKYMTQQPIDMFNYHSLKMFVHGETGEDFVKGYKKFAFKDTNNYDAEMFLHFGDDTSNYYEYRAPVHPDWNGNDILIKFSDLTDLKALMDSTNISQREPVKGGWPGATYQVHGNPRLDRIQFISIGIENPANKKLSDPSVLTGELWVDELRLTDVDDTHGWAYKMDANIKLADIGSIAFSLTQRDPYFHGLEDHFGTRNTSRAWSLSTSFAFDRLLPETWNGSVLNFSYSHSESINKPLYLPGTDILVEAAATRVAADTSTNPNRQYKNADDVRAQSEDMSITDSYSVPTLKLNIPAKTWLVTETINKMSIGYNFTKSYQRNSSTEYADAWSWNASFRYGTQFNPNNYLLLGALKFFFTPQQMNFGATLSRSQSQTKLRSQTNPNDTLRTLNAQRSMDFTWQFFQGGLFDLGVAYNVNISSSLVHLETDQYGNQRTFTAILGDIFFSDRLIDFGIDQNYNQGITLNTKVTAPKVLMLDKILTPNLRYSVNYSWTNNIQAGPIGRSAGWSGGPLFSLDVNIKPITEAIWSPTQASPPIPTPLDTSKKPLDATKKEGSFNLLLKQFDLVSRILIKNTIFDFEKLNFSFTQSNTSQNNGVFGNTGFANIFARAPFFQPSLDENGPKFLYQFGLISDPNGELVLKTKGTFPFFTGYTVPGIRAANANITDAFSQNNQIAMHTSRPLWDGATIQLDWKLGWTYNENQTSNTDSLGHIIPSAISSNVSGDMDRSFISLPINFFKTNLDNVNSKYNALIQDANDTRDASAKLSQAFEQGLEAFPWLSKILGSLAPRANWSIHWDGLENFSFLKSFASRISLDHAYTSDYKQRWQMTPTLDSNTQITSMSKVITSQTVTYGFSPLIGVNITFKDFIKGNLSATFRYGATTSYDLAPSSQNVTETSTTDISVTGTYSRQGFEIPFFGVSLMNNIDITFTYGYSHNASLLYDFNNFQKDGLPMNGSGRTTMEPRIRYTLSERVTASVYYRYTRLAPDAGGSPTPGSTTNEGGADFHVLIQ
jgi:cell surface protein SprA